tara:strand:+ start:17311 stop:18159 length:849 start_codon:yes stop_codon:yes gene_type:complete
MIPLKKYFNFFAKKKKYILLDYKKDKEIILNELSSESILAIDTEFDWRNTYYPILSLIQIATSKKILIIDVLNAENFKDLKNLIEKCKMIIFHAVRSDATVLSTSLGLKVENVFDIQIAQNLISKKINQNYAAIVNQYFPIKLKKSQTNSNWLKRPLTKTQIDYAVDDVRYLIQIYEEQKKLLQQKLSMALELSKKEAMLGNQELHISRLSKFNLRDDYARKIFMWRENYASKKNVPTSYILKNNQIKKIANIYNFEKDYSKIEKIINNKVLAEDLFKHLIK